MKILIDADGCPVVKLTVDFGKKKNLEVIVYCDSSHHFEKTGVQVITVMKGQDAVDFELIKNVEKGDIVITQDYGLAAMVLSKGGAGINQNGLIYTHENIDQLLFSRHESARIRRAGGRMKGPKKRTQADDESFIQSLNSLINKAK